MIKGKPYTVSVTLIVAMGGFLLGFDATVISGAVPFIKKYFDLTGTSGDLKLGWAVSCLGWGALGGNALAGFLSDAFGRKKVLMLTARVLYRFRPAFGHHERISPSSCCRGFSAASRSAVPSSSRRFISLKSRRPPCAAAWFPSTS